MRKLQLTDALCARLGVSPVSPDSSKLPAGFERPTIATPGQANVVDALAEHDLLFQAMRRLGLVIGGPRNSAMGRAYDVICPWVDEHSGRATTGTAYVPILQRFECHHGHCQGRTGEHLQARLNELLRIDSGGLIGAGDLEFDVIDPADVPLPDVLARRETEAERRFFARFVYLRPKDAFWDMDRRVLVKDRDLNSGWTARLRDVLPMVGRGVRRQPMPPSTWFLGDKRGRRVDGLIQWPDEPMILRHEDQICANLWRPLVRPLKDAPAEHVTDFWVKPWLLLFWHVVGEKAPEARAIGQLVLDWLAMVLATNIKGGWQVVLIGNQGIGKDMILLPLMRALGDQRAQPLRSDDLNSGFSQWLDKRLIQLSEMRQTTRGSLTPHDQMARLKAVFDPGKDWMTVNPKYAPQYKVRNVLMGWFTSNEELPLRLEKDDRRFLIVDCTDTLPASPGAYARVGDWFERNNGLALVAEWLFRRWEAMSDKRRQMLLAPAPMTGIKQYIIEESEDPIDVYLQILLGLEPPDMHALPDVVTTHYVVGRLQQAQREGLLGASRSFLHPVSVGKRLAKMGATQLHGGEPLKVEGRRTRIWCLRNKALYNLLGPADLAKICNVISSLFSGGVRH